MRLFIGAEHIISPLGNSIEQNWNALITNETGIKDFLNAGFNKETVFLSKITSLPIKNKFDTLLEDCLNAIAQKIDSSIINSKKTIVIISTTKGDLETTLMGTIVNSIIKLKESFQLKNLPLVVSNACASGVIAINTGADLIRASVYENAIVIGVDVISDFVLFGFQSLFAISDKPCAPFDKDRKGITLGEGCAAVVISKSDLIYNQSPLEYVNGTSSNDSNHISGPSRTGEGLFRTVNRTLQLSRVASNEIDFISAHGTATLFNDDMESMAFDRLQMNEVPLNSYKGYFGHTLGAAGVIETACCMQSMRNNVLIKNQGMKEAGTVKQLNVVTQNQEKEINLILKTASGFGGCNASLILRKI